MTTWTGADHDRWPVALRKSLGTRLFSLDECVGAALDVLDHLGAGGPVDWVGNAWGGHVGILFAVGQTGRCRSLVTSAPPFMRCHRPSSAATVRSSPLPGHRSHQAAGQTVCDALLGADAEAIDPQATQLVAGASRRPGRRGMYLAARSVMLQRPDRTPTCATLTTPTLIVSGAADGLWGPGAARVLAALMPSASAAAVPGGGHVAPLAVRSAPSRRPAFQAARGSGTGDGR
jgi:pimeloyl-ACP methyl ester carboxylesterase